MQQQRDTKATMRRYKICVIIPTYNNAGTLQRVISDVLEYSDDVLVVNDGSTDATPDILAGMQDRITIVGYADNRGKGYALKSGFEKAREMGYEYAITIDSDGQHYASDIPLFVEAIAGNPGAMIIGKRDLSGVDINGKSSFANKFSNFWFNVQTGKRLEDTQTGYRAYPLNKLYGLNLLTSRYEAELELLVFAAWNGVEILSIPINVYYPPQSQRVSHFKPAKDFTRISILNTILCFGAIVYGLPVRIADALVNKKILNKEFRLFTHRKGERKDAATTLGRLYRSLVTISFFLITSIGVLPFVNMYMRLGKSSDKKKLRLHRMLMNLSRFETKCFPGSRVRYENKDERELERPSLIICNHQSHLDLPVLMSLHPKLIFLTNDWVWNSKYFGNLIRSAEYLPVSAGMDVIIPKLKDLVRRGYSIVVFPEGTRSEDCRIQRFHQGAFKLAEELGLDILPMTIHGAGDFLPKKDFMLRKCDITLRILPRVSKSDIASLLLRERASKFRKLIKEEYDKIADEKETAEYFKSLVLYKYAYRGWKVVSKAREELRRIIGNGEITKEEKACKKVRIQNSGIGTYALLYALVNKGVDVHAYESNKKDYEIAVNTGGLPDNLTYHHAVWDNEYGDDEIWDKTITLER